MQINCIYSFTLIIFLMKNIRHCFGGIFLFAYLFFLILHMRDVRLTPIFIYMLCAGGVLALAAHSSRKYGMIVLLLVHMFIEWIEWAHQHVSIEGIFFDSVHAVMDFIFFSREVRIHGGRYASFSICVLVCMVFVAIVFGRSITVSGIGMEIMEPFVAGGIFGCVGSHLFMYLKKSD